MQETTSHGQEQSPPPAQLATGARAIYFLGSVWSCSFYYLRSISIGESLAYPPRLAVDLGSYVDGEAHGWARQPYGYFDPAPRPRDIIHTYSYVPTAPSGAPHERVKAR